MDWSLHESSRIAGLPRLMRGPALLARNLWPELTSRHGYRYRADGIATHYHSPFLGDDQFARHYADMVRWWYPAAAVDVRWRMWILVSLARSCRRLPSQHYAEFGSYRGGCAYMLLAMGALPPGGRLHLFDTFEGIPPAQLTPAERGTAWSHRYLDASAEALQTHLDRWSEQVAIWPGDVLQTVPEPTITSLAFAHFDLNASAPTRHVLEAAWPLVCPGGIVVFDDYGEDAFLDQRVVVDAYFAHHGVELTALPTGQALAMKR